MLKTLMASALILTVVSPVKAERGPGLGYTDTINANIQAHPHVCTNDQDGRLSLRKGPGQRFRSIKQIPNGHALILVEGKYDSQGFYWWKVLHNRSQGWVRADYVCDDPQ